ncbi:MULTISPECIES: S1C family serine protease [unclassified Bosea (in: a-proteobacteria)]|uniref:S1C family serine protease n=1 Tax=unclassified Bosea (in: a-proteobacteria) TaxID=2653178 RepID=UPI003F8F6804
MTTPTTSKSILKRGALIAGAATLGIGLAAGLADGALMQNHSAFAQPIQLSGVQTQLPSFADMVDHVKPAVVSVRVKTSVAAASAEDGESGIEGLPPGHPLERFLRRFGEEGQGQGQGPRQGKPQPRQGMSQGSGFFVSQDGYVVTNNHVVQNATEVQLVTDSGKTLAAKVIGTDPRTDIALLKVTEEGNYPFVQLAKTKPRIGDWVLAVGNPFGLGGTVTAGIVSAQGRDIGSGPYDDFLQIDAAVNRGNSGGPTFNQKGEVVGVNTAIYSPSGGNVGIAFAVPAATVDSVVASLKKDGSVARGFIGVQIQPVTAEVADAIGLKEPHGALIAEAQANGPAAKAGIKRGDTIIAVNGDKVADARDLSKKIAVFAPGTKTTLTVWRDGKEREVSFEVGRQPAA